MMQTNNQMNVLLMEKGILLLAGKERIICGNYKRSRDQGNSLKYETIRS